MSRLHMLVAKGESTGRAICLSVLTIFVGGRCLRLRKQSAVLSPVRCLASTIFKPDEKKLRCTHKTQHQRKKCGAARTGVFDIQTSPRTKDDATYTGRVDRT